MIPEHMYTGLPPREGLRQGWHVDRVRLDNFYKLSGCPCGLSTPSILDALDFVKARSGTAFDDPYRVGTARKLWVILPYPSIDVRER